MKLHDLAPGATHLLTLAKGQVKVGDADAEETFLPEAWALIFGEAGIQIRGMRQASDAGSVVITGTAIFPALAETAPGLASPLLNGDIDVTANFVAPDVLHPNALAISLRLDLPRAWKFSDSFPELVLFAESSNAPLDLDGFTLAAGFLHVTTHEGEVTLSDGAKAVLTQGLYLDAQWQPGQLLGLIEHPPQVVHLHGPVVIQAVALPAKASALARLPWDIRQSMAGIHLQADLGAQVEVPLPPYSDESLRVMRLGFRIYNPLVSSPGFDTDEYGPSRAYVGTLFLPGPGGGEVARIVAEMQRMGADDEVSITSDFDALTLDKLMATLGRLAGGHDVIDVLPKDAGKGAAGFRLQRASLNLVRQPGKGYEVQSTGLSFGMGNGAAPWAPFAPGQFSNLIQIAYGSVQVVVVKPFDAAQREIVASVRGTASFLKGTRSEGLTLNVSLNYPGFYLSARQAGRTKVDMALFKEMGLPLPAFLNRDLEIADLTFAADPGSHFNFSMTLAPGTSWDFDGHKLPQLALAVSYRAIGQGTEQKTELGWQLKASAQEGEEAIPIGAMIEHLGSAVAGFKFSGVLPAALQKLSVTEVEIICGHGGEQLAFACWGQLPLADGLELECGLTIDRDGKTSQTRLGAQLVFRPARGEPLSFSLQFESESAGKAGGALSGTASASLPLRQAVATLAAKLGIGAVPDIPQFLDVTVTSLFLYFHTGTGQFVLGATTDVGNTALIVFSEKDKDGNRRSALLVDKHLRLGLSSLPLVGDRLAKVAGTVPAVEDVGIDRLHAAVTRGLGNTGELAALNGIIDAAQQAFKGGALPRIPAPVSAANGRAAYLPSGVQLHLGVSCYFDDKPQPQLALPYEFDAAGAADQTGPVSAPPTARPDAAEALAATVWFPVQRNFGSVSVRRIGFACSPGALRLLMDASITLSGMNMQLQGLSLALPVERLFKLDRRHILDSLVNGVEGMSTHLDGLTLGFESGPLSISGGLLSVSPPPANAKYAYDGTLLLKADKWAVSAVGSFAELESGASSLFAFGYLNAILGGPAFFFVTGLAAGFGYNRNLTLPTLNALPAFPLIAACTAEGEQVATIQRDMAQYLYPAAGRHWIAAGVRFSSFRMIESFALFTVLFGESLEVALMGLSTLSLPAPTKADPKPKASIARVQLALEATYAPDEGVLKVAAQLTPASYILSEKCHLMGGFALYTWFKDEFIKDEAGKPTSTRVENGYRSGDFVLSIGGYHPDFQPPAHYPSVPRVAANWQVENVSIKASLYFALTPLAIMTGGTLDANFETGNFKAWFLTRVNFLLYWEPLAYQASMKLLLGASYKVDWFNTTKTFTCQVGVDLELYGPPFGGRAVVDLYVCSFTIDLGARQDAPKKLSWPEFEARMLPAPAPERMDEPAVCLTRASAGLIRELPAATANEPRAWVVNPETFVLLTSSAIPSSAAPILNGRKAENLAALQPFGVRPCDLLKDRLQSQMSIEWLTESGQPVANAWDIWEIQASTERLPAAVWAAVELPADRRKALSVNDFRADQMTEGLVTGYTLKPRHPAQTHRTAAIVLSKLPMTTRTLLIADESWARPEIARSATHADANRRDAERFRRVGDIAHLDLVSKRQALRGALARQGIELSTKPTTRYLAQAAAQQALLAAPSLWKLGEMQPS